MNYKTTDIYAAYAQCCPWRQKMLLDAITEVVDTVTDAYKAYRMITELVAAARAGRDEAEKTKEANRNA